MIDFSSLGGAVAPCHRGQQRLCGCGARGHRRRAAAAAGAPGAARSPTTAAAEGGVATGWKGCDEGDIIITQNACFFFFLIC